MKNFFNKVQNKANELAIRAKTTIDNAKAEGYIDTGVKIIIGVVFGALGVVIPQMAIAMFSKKSGIGGADIKLSTAAALSLGFYGGVIGYMVGLVFAIVFQTIYNKDKKQSNKEAFPLLPFLSTGLMIGYFI